MWLVENPICFFFLNAFPHSGDIIDVIFIKIIGFEAKPLISQSRVFADIRHYIFSCFAPSF